MESIAIALIAGLSTGIPATLTAVAFLRRHNAVVTSVEAARLAIGSPNGQGDLVTMLEAVLREQRAAGIRSDSLERYIRSIRHGFVSDVAAINVRLDTHIEHGGHNN